MQAEQSRLDRIEAAIERNTANIEALTQDVKQLRDESKELSIRFNYYQQSTQAIINLAFFLVASATISVFITVILKQK
jgi:hypothetical protein